MSGLRINTNVQAMNAQRNLGINTGMLNKSLERLSSGMRINKAADDAAGLAISETLRAQIRGMNQAVANSQDGINLIQTAEGGLNETTNILQRIRELAVQAANDTYTQGDRSKIQAEIDQLKEELTRIASTTQFNGRTLLDGSVSVSAAMVQATTDIKQNQRIGAVNAAGVPVFGDMISGVSISQASSTMASVDVGVTFKLVATVTSGIYNLEVRGSDGTYTLMQDYNGTVRGTGITVTLSSGATFSVAFGTVSVALADVGDTSTVQLTATRAAVTIDQALTFQIGANEGQIVKSGMGDFRAAALRMESVGVSGTTEDSSRLMAQNLIGVVDDALAYINTERAKMGAMQNRLEHTIANLNVSVENLSASESRIRDTDVAKETSALTRAQILVQAGTSILAQANATPQNALSLLKG
jgi:flagellin